MARSYDPVLGRFTTIDPLAEKYYSISPYAYCLNNPLRYTDPGGDSVRVYTEAKSNHGAGHSWISIGEDENMIVYSYGRYNGTNKGPEGILNSVANGPGVLLKLTGEDAKAYNEKTSSATGMSTFVVKDISDKQVATVLDDIFNSSNKLPDNPQSDYYKNPSARIIDEYKLTSNNCTTMVSDVLNKSGSDVFKTSMIQQTSSFGTWTSFPVIKRFVLPNSMQNYLNKKSNKQGVVYKTK